MNLTKRDKFLIYICAIFAVCAMTYMLVISKNAKELNSLRSESMMEEQTAEDIRFINQNFDFTKELYDETSGSYKTYLNGFFELSSENESISEYFTYKILEHNLLPMNFSVSEESDRSGDMLMYEASSYYTPYFTLTGDTNVYESVSPFIVPRTIDLAYNGLYDDIVSFVDFVNETDGLFIKEVSFAADKSYDDGDEYGSTLTGSYMNSEMTLVAFFYDKEHFDEYLADPDKFAAE